ncbi:hypothetical protein CC1G_04268 [Coprinopsis cinerea okayama7|uniref:Uncharacterized protein n=1 Tax=Coprinopsis cinerea (strain Okayama-7 / 130 / ATCC MYA-4618 / FGSC 9003) TaxID=240176 RepID=A8NFI0_COPC7|nr:hypothetical protein CC1G_04268 [Coprinopsis cinerea okayama7\|eukprot:XP_001833289.2 hypothetical protein CC1G_04268 [Coprinopsis cinerea okayama7\
MFAQLSRNVVANALACRRSVTPRFSFFQPSILPATARLYSTPVNNLEQTRNVLESVTRNLPETDYEKRWADMSAIARHSAQKNPPAGPYDGRKVTVQKGKGVADAMRALDSILTRNKVRQQLRLQQRHEKRGEKLRRLRSLRWRKLFANEVRSHRLFSFTS